MFRKSILALFAALSVTAAFPAVTNRVGALAPSAVVTTGEGYTNLSERITAASAGAAAALEIHDTNTVRHVTAQERSTWNAKQAALTPGVHYATPAQVSNAAVVAYSYTAAAVARIAALEAGTNTWHAKQNALVAGTDYAQPGSWSNDISYVESLTVTNSDRLAGIEAMTNSWSSKQGALTAGTDYATPTQLDTAKIYLGAVDTALSNRIVTLEGNVSTWNAKQDALVAGTDYATPAQVSGDITTVNASIDGVASRVTVLEGNVTTWNAKQNALTAGTDYATPGSVTSVSNRMEETDASLSGRLALVEAGTNTWNAKQAALTAETDYATPTQLVTEAGTRLAADNALSGRLDLIESNTNLWTGKQGALVAGTDYITPDDANVVIVPLVDARLGDLATSIIGVSNVIASSTNVWNGKQDALTAGVDYVTPAGLSMTKFHVSSITNASGKAVVAVDVGAIDTNKLNTGMTWRSGSSNWMNGSLTVGNGATLQLNNTAKVWFINPSQVKIGAGFTWDDSPTLLSWVNSNESDPNVHSWAKAANKPTYTADEVGALSSDSRISDFPADIEVYDSYVASGKLVYDKAVRKGTDQYIASVAVAGGNQSISFIYGDGSEVYFTPSVDAPVKTVNNKTGYVQLSAIDVGAVSTSGGTYTGEVKVEDSDGDQLRLRSTRIDVNVTNETARVKTKHISSTTTTSASIFASDEGSYLSLSGDSGGLDISNTGKISTDEGGELQLPVERSGTLALTTDVPGKWALVNVTNATGVTVTAGDLNAYTKTEADNKFLETVTNVVNEVKSEFWDSSLSVNWTLKMENGSMRLYATTNVNNSVSN